MNNLPKTVTRQRRDCDLNPGPSAPESSTLTTRLPSHAIQYSVALFNFFLFKHQRQRVQATYMPVKSCTVMHVKQ